MELVELYQNYAPNRVIATMIQVHSLFEVDGYLALLCDQGLPVKQLDSLTRTEQTSWNAYRHNPAADVSRSLTPNQEFKA
ncbi:MAG: hypothetical protein AAGG02_02990 [Cyanobacteria bacterium P01_H01_bin.15]